MLALKIDKSIWTTFLLTICTKTYSINSERVFLPHAIKSWKFSKLMKGFVCRRIGSRSDEKIWKDVQSSYNRNADKVNHYYHQLLYDSVLLSFDVQRTLSIPRSVSLIVTIFLSELGQGWHRLNFAFTSLCKTRCCQRYFVHILYFFKRKAKMHFFCGRYYPREISNNIFLIERIIIIFKYLGLSKTHC